MGISFGGGVKGSGGSLFRSRELYLDDYEPIGTDNTTFSLTVRAMP